MRIFSFCANVHHFWGQNTGRTVERGEGLIELSHLSADCRFCFDNINREACVGNVKRGLNSGDTAADNKRTFCNGAFTGVSGALRFTFATAALLRMIAFSGADRHFFMYPGTLLTDIGYFHHIGDLSPRQPPFCGRLPRAYGRAGTDHNACELMFFYCILYNVLSCLGTHILIIGGENNTGFIFKSLRNCLYINRSGNICTAVADKNSNSLHGYSSPFLLGIFTHGAHDCLLGISSSIMRYIVQVLNDWRPFGG